ncbi:MAG: carbon starvation protein A [Candidatus Thorarchaeota archaeon]
MIKQAILEIPGLYPVYFVIVGLAIFIIAYLVYARWFDSKVIKADPKKTTPANMYMDGVEFFPTEKSVLFGFQFKTIAATGPIMGPFIALLFGWLPAFLWIVLGNFFIGWVQDYSSTMLSVRHDGKSFGPLAYEFVSPRSRNVLLGYIVVYLLIILGIFAYVVALLFDLFMASIIPTIMVVVAGVVVGYLLYKVKMPVIQATLIGLGIIVIGFLPAIIDPAFSLTQFTGGNQEIMDLGFMTLRWFDVLLILTCVIVFLGAVLPIGSYSQPINYLSFYVCYFGLILLLVASLLTPFLQFTGTIGTVDYVNHPLTIQAPAIGELFAVDGATGALTLLWPVMFVAIACGAVSGWHSLVGSSGTSRQLNLETDALPVAAGSMLSEGVLALVALAAFSVVPGARYGPLAVGTFVNGATMMTHPIVGMIGLNQAVTSALLAALVILFAITIMYVALRFFRLALAELLEPVPALSAAAKNVYIGAFVGTVLMFLFAETKAFVWMWILFGGANQLMASLALILVTLWLVRERKPQWFVSGIPAVFMFATCIAALLLTSYNFLLFALDPSGALASGLIGAIGTTLAGRGIHDPLSTPMVQLMSVAFLAIALILVILACLLAWDAYKAFQTGRAEAPPTVTPA